MVRGLDAAERKSSASRIRPAKFLHRGTLSWSKVENLWPAANNGTGGRLAENIIGETLGENECNRI